PPDPGPRMPSARGDAADRVHLAATPCGRDPSSDGMGTKSVTSRVPFRFTRRTFSPLASTGSWVAVARWVTTYRNVSCGSSANWNGAALFRPWARVTVWIFTGIRGLVMSKTPTVFSKLFETYSRFPAEFDRIQHGPAPTSVTARTNVKWPSAVYV